jgi:hypothetical protein
MQEQGRVIAKKSFAQCADRSFGRSQNRSRAQSASAEHKGGRKQQKFQGVFHRAARY